MWGLGILMYILLSGTSPFGGAFDQRALCRAIKSGQWDFNDKLWAFVSLAAKVNTMQTYYNIYFMILYFMQLSTCVRSLAVYHLAMAFPCCSFMSALRS